jgi:DNA ligase-1
MQKTLFKPKPLTVPFVFSNLKEIALSAGHSVSHAIVSPTGASQHLSQSQGKKVSIVTKLLAACKGEEAKYIVRSLEGKLRIGNAERTVLVALAHAVVLAEQDRCMQHVLENHHKLIFMSSWKEMEYGEASITVRRGV